MKLPDYYHKTDIDRLYFSRKSIVQKEASRANLAPAENDKRKVGVLMIDNQLDFIFDSGDNSEKGSLAIPGAMDDTLRAIEWIYRNVEVITNIYVSLDTHKAWQIFYPTWWIDKEGNHPEPFTPITYQDVLSQKFRPVSHITESIDYVRQLEKKNRYTLTIWPYHTMLGDIGHAMPPALFEAIMFHSIARKSFTAFEEKGLIPFTEHYSIFAPEVMCINHELMKYNNKLIHTMFKNNDLVFALGQAKSHCLMSSLDMLILYLLSYNKEWIKKLRILIDATSPVAPPPINPLPDYLNFPVIADKRFKEYESDYGIPLVTTFDKII